jgi:hypothetical protein
LLNPPVYIQDIPWSSYTKNPHVLENLLHNFPVFAMGQYPPLGKLTNGELIIQFFKPEHASEFIKKLSECVCYSTMLTVKLLNAYDIQFATKWTIYPGYPGSEPKMGALGEYLTNPEEFTAKTLGKQQQPSANGQTSSVTSADFMKSLLPLLSDSLQQSQVQAVSSSKETSAMPKVLPLPTPQPPSKPVVKLSTVDLRHRSTRGVDRSSTMRLARSPPYKPRRSPPRSESRSWSREVRQSHHARYSPPRHSSSSKRRECEETKRREARLQRFTDSRGKSKTNDTPSQVKPTPKLESSVPKMVVGKRTQDSFVLPRKLHGGTPISTHVSLGLTDILEEKKNMGGSNVDNDNEDSTSMEDSGSDEHIVINIRESQLRASQTDLNLESNTKLESHRGSDIDTSEIKV